MNAERQIANLLSTVGIEINGPNRWDIQVHNPQMFSKIIQQGSLGIGETYMAGDWDCQALDEFFFRILNGELYKNKIYFKGLFWSYIKNYFLNIQSKKRAVIVGRKHYDLGNDLFEAMLDKRLTYSCAYWNKAENLDQAQEKKLDLICKKLYLKPGHKILDIGCGWGSLAKFAAEKYGCHVVGITISQAQLELGQKLCQGLPVELKFQDYRTVNGKFDRIVSVGQMEHVGYKNYKQYMDLLHKNLKDDGLALIHTIVNNKTYRVSDPWIEKYIFPNGLIPSVKQIAESSEDYLVLEDGHNLSIHYDRTLMAWFHNFDKHWESLKEAYSSTFYRMWKYYLMVSAANFRARKLQLWQFVLSKGLLEGYTPLRDV